MYVVIVTLLAFVLLMWVMPKMPQATGTAVVDMLLVKDTEGETFEEFWLASERRNRGWAVFFALTGASLLGTIASILLSEYL